MHPSPRPSWRFVRLLVAAALIAVGTIAANVAGTAPIASADPPPDFFMFDNGILRFGGNNDDNRYSGSAEVTTPEHPINTNGLPKQPFYRSSQSSNWFTLTYWTYPLNLAIGTGTSGGNWSGATVADVTALDNLVIDTSGFVATGAAGTGVKGCTRRSTPT